MSAPPQLIHSATKKKSTANHQRQDIDTRPAKMHPVHLLTSALTIAVFEPSLAAAAKTYKFLGNVEFHNDRGCGGTRIDPVKIYDDGGRCHDLKGDWRSYYWRPQSPASRKSPTPSHQPNRDPAAKR
jgi:hypothetical protein